MQLLTMKTIREDEGESLTVYKDTLGHLTVGVGHKLSPEDKSKVGDVISPYLSKTLFLQDMRIANSNACRLLVDAGIPRSPTVLRVVTNMTFQMGLEGVRAFRLFWAALEARDYPRAAKEMLDSKWAREDSPARAQRLAAEIKLLDRYSGATMAATGDRA